jgi:hypothetical protein
VHQTKKKNGIRLKQSTKLNASQIDTVMTVTRVEHATKGSKTQLTRSDKSGEAHIMLSMEEIVPIPCTLQ